MPLLAERFRENGFATAAFVSSIVLESQSGLDRGFDLYSDRFEGSGGDAQFLSTVQRQGEDTVAEAVAWLGGQRGRRVFLWLHLYEPHDPYEPPEPYASRYAGRPYDGEVAWTDELFGRFEDALGSLGMRDATALVVTSDHGEGLGEHDESLHGFFAYQSTLRVPLIVRGPGIVAGRRLERPVRLVDVFPTALELAGWRPRREPRPDGASRRRCGAGRVARRGHRLCRDARAAAALRLERPARDPRRPLQVHPGAAAGALRPARRSGRAAQPGLRAVDAGAGDARRARDGAGRGAPAAGGEHGAWALAGAHRAAGGARLRRRVGGGGDRDAGSGPQGQDRGVSRRQQPDPRGPAGVSRERLRAECRQAAAGPGARHLELRGALLPRSGARWRRARRPRRAATSTRPRAASRRTPPRGKEPPTVGCGWAIAMGRSRACAAVPRRCHATPA